jgi:alanine racemase
VPSERDQITGPAAKPPRADDVSETRRSGSATAVVVGAQPSGGRPAWAEVDLGAVRQNVSTLAATVAPAALLAVVKADGYGHGAVPVASAALDAGATWLGVATVDEGAALRIAGIDAPVLLLAEPADDAVDVAVELGLTAVVCSDAGVRALARAAAEQGRGSLPVHLKVDTGMHRVGCSPSEALDIAHTVQRESSLELEALMTHLAVADEPDHPLNDAQLGRFEAVLERLGASGLRPRLVHAANSAGAIAIPRSRYDLTRVGICMYGIAPSADLAGAVALVPAMSLKALVTATRTIEAGEGVSYGARWTARERTIIATIPLGYADGVPRSFGLVGGEVLVRGRRCPVIGAVTMDQLMVEVGASDVRVGDEVVLIGSQGDETVTAEEWADHLGTIAYEVVARIGPRVPRRYRG